MSIFLSGFDHLSDGGYFNVESDSTSSNGYRTKESSVSAAYYFLGYNHMIHSSLMIKIYKPNYAFFSKLAKLDPVTFCLQNFMVSTCFFS